MKRFLFEQQQILILRRRQRDWAETQLRSLVGEVEQAKLAQQECNQDLTRLTERIGQETSNSLSVLSSISQQLNVCHAMQEDLSKLESRCAEARLALRRSNADVEALELLRTEQQTEHRRKDLKKEQDELEYRAMTVWHANSRATNESMEEQPSD